METAPSSNANYLREKLGYFGLLTKLPLAPTVPEVIESVGSLRLLYFKSPAPTRTTPVFILPSLINRYYILDLLPEKSFIRHLLQQSKDVYVLDWGTPEDHDRWLSFEQVMQERVPFLMNLALQHARAKSLALVGHCLGGTLATMLACLHPRKIQSLTLLTTPIHFEKSGQLGAWAQHPHFNLEVYLGAHGHAPWLSLQASFELLRPLMTWSKIKKLKKKWSDATFQRNFWALEVWGHDSVSMYGSFYRAVIAKLYQQNTLASSGLVLGDQRIDLKNIACPVLSISALEDHIVTQSSVMRSSDLSSSHNFTQIEVLGGHISGLLSSQAKASLWPQISQWILTQSQEPLWL